MITIEIIDFFPQEKDDTKQILTGSMRVRIVNLGIHILGITVQKNKNGWYFFLPGRTAISHKTGNNIRYPFITFDDRELHHELMNQIREKGQAYIEKRLEDAENPLKFLECSVKDKSRSKLPEQNERLVETNKAIVEPKAKVQEFYTPKPLAKRYAAKRG
jgi:hypothetical protein